LKHHEARPANGYMLAARYAILGVVLTFLFTAALGMSMPGITDEKGGFDVIFRYGWWYYCTVPPLVGIAIGRSLAKEAGILWGILAGVLYVAVVPGVLFLGWNVQ
jgi:hypothetical protein